MASKKVSNNKCKFDEGEKVLCYEPDPAKTKVLYDSKVLKLVPEKDDHGRKFYKFLIHFQGWNSTWDRYVTDEFILKDTEENRKLQKKLADEAQLTPGGHLYRKERKRGRGRCDVKTVSTDCEDNVEDSTDETPMMVDKDIIPVPIINLSSLPKRRLPELTFTEDLKYHIGYNCHLTHNMNYLVKLPCQPNVVTLFENYLKYFARTNCSGDNYIPKKGRRREVFDKRQIGIRYNICVEVLDGLRICFNTFLFRKLLINENEQIQYNEAIRMSLEPPVTNIDVPLQNGDQQGLQDNVQNGEETEDQIQIKAEYASSVISQNSQRTCSASDCSLTKSQCLKLVKNSYNIVRDEYISKADQWKAVPDNLYYEEVKEPSIIYGVNHLLRLLDKLPKILKYTSANDEKLAAIYSVSNGLLNYLSTQTHLFGIKQYVSAAKKDKEPSETVKQNEEPVRSKRLRKL